jgi:glutamine amidotransferase
LKIPQIGWNQIQIRKTACPLLKGISDESYVYFVHSYFPRPSDQGLICTETDYGVPFASMIWKDNVFACQFHPEKSQAVGLKILENFVRL